MSTRPRGAAKLERRRRLSGGKPVKVKPSGVKVVLLICVAVHAFKADRRSESLDNF